jgi:hypothetical protein
MKCWGCQWALEGVNRTSLKVKDFGPTGIDYITTDLDYRLLRIWASDGRVLPEVVTNQKRDIVDTSFHASCVFGHNPSPELIFPYIWE